MSINSLNGSIAFIPARGGSKRLPRKNLLKLEGKSFIQRAIETAIETKIFDRVFFSTDDNEMYLEGKKFTEDSIMRPASLGRDNVDLTKVLLNFIESNQIVNNKICMLMPNCPLRNYKDIINTGLEMSFNTAHASMSVVSYDWRSPEWAIYKKKNNFAIQLSKVIDLYSLKKKKLFCATGAVRWVDTKHFIKNKTFYPKKLSIYELPWHRAIDIDNFDDLKIAHLITWSRINGYKF